VPGDKTWLEVRVVDDATGKPAPRANVRVMDHGARRGTPPLQAVADDEGVARFNLWRPSAGYHVVAVSSDFRSRALVERQVRPKDPKAHVELRVQPDPAFQGPAVQVGVRVVDADGQSLAGVPVALFESTVSPLETWRRLDTATGKPSSLVVTDAYGVARFPGPLEGSITVQARPLDRAWATAEVRPQPGPWSTPSMRLVCADEVGVDVRLVHPPGDRTSITAMAPLWFHPIDWSTTPHEAISERFTSVVDDCATLPLPKHTSSRGADWPDNCARLGRPPAGVVMQAGPDLTLFAGWPAESNAEPVSVRVPSITTFRLRVVRAGSGVTVDGARVHVRSETLDSTWDVGAASRALTDLRGFATVQCVPGRITDIVVEDPRGFEHRVPLPTGKRPRTGREGTVADPEPFYVEVPEVTPRVTGRVVMRPHEGPPSGSMDDVAPILVACLDPSTGVLQRQIVGPDGRYEFAVRSGAYCQIVARAAGWTSEIVSARHYDELELQPSSLLVGRVLDVERRGLADVQVVLGSNRWSPYGPERLWGAAGVGLDAAFSGGDGRFSLEVHAGEDFAALTTEHPRYGRGSTTYVISKCVQDVSREDKGPRDAPLVLPPIASTGVGIHFVDVAGLPIPGVRMKVVSQPWWEGGAWRPSPSNARGFVYLGASRERERAELLEPDLVGPHQGSLLSV
ncbi:MAG: hypothetical protein R3F05_20950, partial [Planctomycetota bacterium]